MENTLGRQGDATHQNSRILLMAISILLLLVLIGTLVARLTGYTAVELPPTTVTEMRQLGFRDLPRGVVEVYDWQSGDIIMRIESGEGSFIRGVVRSLVRQRRGLDPAIQVPFELARLSDGRVVLSDPATGEAIDLIAFGPTNVGSFIALLRRENSLSVPESGAI